jgi:hypothetical protein
VNLLSGVQPIEQRHRNVHHDDIRAKAPGHLYRLPPILRFTDDIEIVFGIQQYPKRFANGFVIFRKKDGDSLRRSHFLPVIHRGVVFSLS